MTARYSGHQATRSSAHELAGTYVEGGGTCTAQYFGRARFEYHPENPPLYDVLLERFGRRILAASQPDRCLCVACRLGDVGRPIEISAARG